MSAWPSDTEMLDWLAADEDRVRELLVELERGEHAELREALAALMARGL